MENVQIFEIKQYMVIFRQAEQRLFNDTEVIIRGMVRCTGDEYSMDVVFYGNESDYPDPIYDIENHKGYMFMPMSDMMIFIDILRNEKPIYGHLRGDRPEWTSVTTSQEPVGEGERDSNAGE